MNILSSAAKAMCLIRLFAYCAIGFSQNVSTENTTRESLLSSLNDNSLSQDSRRRIEGEIYNLDLKDPKVKYFEQGAKHFRSDYRDSCWLQLRAITLNSLDVNSLALLYQDTDYAPPAYTQEKDANIFNADQTNFLHVYIANAAPYNLAYVSLVNLISPYTSARFWDAAAKQALKYEQYFNGDKRFKQLIKILQEQEEEQFHIYSIGSDINTTQGGEYTPVPSADGRHLYFCGKNRDDNLGGEDIYISTRIDSTWGKPKLVEGVNTGGSNDAPLAISADGTELIMFRNGTIFSTRKTLAGWGELEQLPAAINSGTWQADAMITSDGKAMLFAADRQTEYEMGKSVNIFVSLKQEDGSWGEPIDLGPTINTTSFDRSPFLHSDMKTLYFCSSGHTSLGGLDVFMSKRLNEDSWTEWSEPVNLGKRINTFGNDWGYKISTDGTTAYFASSDGKQDDIYYFTLPKQYRPEVVTTISGRVRDTQGRPVATTISWEEMESGKPLGESHTDPATGGFYIVLPHGKKIIYYIDDENLFPVSGNIDLTQEPTAVSIENDIEVAAIERMIEDETPMPLNSLFFDTGKATILPESASELNRVAEILKSRAYKIEISGHSDNTGTDELNDRLSQQRAEAVRNYLIGKGIAAETMTAKGYGKRKPIADNDTEEGRKKNRRVEIKFIKQ